jgi:hypothetical protein
MEPRLIAIIGSFLMAALFTVTGIASLATGKNYMKNRNAPLDKVHGRVRFYTCVIFQFAFAAVLLFAAYRWLG